MCIKQHRHVLRNHFSNQIVSKFNHLEVMNKLKEVTLWNFLDHQITIYGVTYKYCRIRYFLSCSLKMNILLVILKKMESTPWCNRCLRIVRFSTFSSFDWLVYYSKIATQIIWSLTLRLLSLGSFEATGMYSENPRQAPPSSINVYWMPVSICPPWLWRLYSYRVH